MITLSQTICSVFPILFQRKSFSISEDSSLRTLVYLYEQNYKPEKGIIKSEIKFSGEVVAPSARLMNYAANQSIFYLGENTYFLFEVFLNT